MVRAKARSTVPARLLEIYEGIAELMDRHAPDTVAVEDVFYAKNVRTTVVLGQARGVVLLAAQQRGLGIQEFPPAEIKKAIAGTGSATKAQVQFMIARLLRLASAPEPADASDGVAAALACAMGARATALIAEYRQ